MRIGNVLDYLIGRRRVLGWLAVVAMVAVVAADMLVPPSYSRFPWDGVGGFGAFYGLVSALLIVATARLLDRALRRDKDYYRDGEYGDHD